MLNYKAINEVLSKTPLCGHALIAQRGMTKEYCAMGALAKSVGAADTDLERYSSDGRDLFNDYKGPLLEKFGIETVTQFQNLMTQNDSAKNSVTRNREVIVAAGMMAADEITKMIEESRTFDGE